MNLKESNSYQIFHGLDNEFKDFLQGKDCTEQLWLTFIQQHSEMMEMLAYAFYAETKLKPSEVNAVYRTENGITKCWFEALDTGKRYDELLRQNQMLHAEIKALTEELESLDNCDMHPLC